jgi:hypothetical protein
MTRDDILRELRGVLHRVQTTTGQASPPVENGAVPSDVLPKFDSIVWPVATIWLAKALDIEIPKDIHIFGGKDGGPPLTLQQTAELVLEKHRPRSALAHAAE